MTLDFMNSETKCICECCMEIIVSITWAKNDELLCDSCEIGQKPDFVPDPTQEQSDLLAKQRSEFNDWRKRNM